MKKPSDPQETWVELRKKIIGLGDHSIRKSYYPELRKQVAELEHLRNLLSSIINSMPSVLIAVDPGWRVFQWNHESERITGVASVKAQGQFLSLVFPRLYESIHGSAPEPGEIPLGSHPRKLILEVNGLSRHFEVSIFPLAGEDARGAVIRMDDVTERLLLEEAFIQSEKLVSLGRLAAGMAHEINNPLAGIVQNAQVISNRLMNDGLPGNRTVAEEIGLSLPLLRRYLDKRNIPELLESVLESGRRAARIVSNMLSFSRKGASEFLFFDIPVLLDLTVELAEKDFDMKKNLDFRHITIVRQYEPDLPPVSCEGSKIQQVFLNILRNGAQAMIEAGVEQPTFILRCYSRGSSVCVDIQDNGPGMGPEIRKQIFDPFFTTKPVGKGAGLGLYVCYCIIRETHGGTLSVTSVPGRSTTFTISLPGEHT